MEHAPLRPVPARPAGPIDPATALREVSSWLPTLPPAAARALALVVLAERPRGEVASALGVSDAELGELLAQARKELRQTVAVLGGSGWCERAEGLISNRLDGELGERDARRLDVHLRNCARCVEHERRLVQATDALVMILGGPAPAPSPETEATPLVEVPAEETPPAEPPTAGTPAAPETSSAERPTAEAAGAEPARGDVSGEEAAPAAEDRGGEEVAPQVAAPAEPAAAPPEEQIAAAAEVLVAARTRGQIAAAVVWNALLAIAVLLTLAAIALTIAGVLGAEL
jgi:hypothetical protein